jgi:hypothetical protein
MLFREIITAYSVNYMKHMYKLCANEEHFTVKAGGILDTSRVAAELEVFICLIQFSQQTAIIFFNSIN